MRGQRGPPVTSTNTYSLPSFPGHSGSVSVTKSFSTGLPFGPFKPAAGVAVGVAAGVAVDVAVDVAAGVAAGVAVGVLLSM